MSKRFKLMALLNASLLIGLGAFFTTRGNHISLLYVGGLLHLLLLAYTMVKNK